MSFLPSKFQVNCCENATLHSEVIVLLFLYRSPPRIPEVQLSEEPFLQVAAALRFEINRALAVLRQIASGKELKKFLAVSTLANHLLTYVSAA